MVQRISRPGNKNSKPRRKNPKTRALNALAQAEAEAGPYDSGIAKHRLGEAPPPSQRASRKRRNDEDEGSDEDEEDESERSGVEEDDGVKWRVGRVDEDEDEDLDSDEAFGESDEERFADWTFRASESGRKSKKIRKEKKELTLDESEEEESEVDSEDQDQDGEGWMDLSTMLDQKEEKSEKRKRAADSDEESEDADSEEGDEDEDSEDDDSDDDSDSDVSMDGDEDEEEADPDRLDQLHNLISSLPTDPSDPRPNKRQRRDDPNEGKAVSEYNLSSQKITLDDLLPTVNTSDATIKKSLKLLQEDSSKGGKLGKLSAPLAKRQQDRLDRSAAYKETKKTLDRWKDTVKTNREAEHLQFPLPGTGSELKAPEKFDSTTHAKPLTTLEEKIAEILKASNMTSENQILKFEDMQSNKLPVEEVQKRTAELRRARELMYREEARAKRIKKIKSKSYHRQLKRDRKKEAEAVAATLKENGEFDEDADEEERDRKRAEERMSQRFKQSKWAKGVKDSGRAGWDDEAREGQQAMMLREDELRRRMHGKKVRDGSDESGSESESESDSDWDGSEDDEVRFRKDLERAEDDDADMKGAGKIGKNILSLKFMQKAEAEKKARNLEELEDLKRSLRGVDSETDEDEREVKGRRTFKPVAQEENSKPEKPERSEFEEKGSESESSDDDDDVEIIVNAANSDQKKPNPFSTSKSQSKRPQLSQGSSEPAEANPWLSADLGTKGKKSAKLKDDSTKSAKISSKLAKAKSAALSTAPTDDVDIDIDLTLTTAPAPTPSTTNPLPKPKKSKKKSGTTITDADSDASDPESDYASDGDIDKQVIAPAIKQRNLVKRAFAGDNVVYEFEKEKKQIIKDEGDQVTDLTLPGWGNWIGEGVSKKKKRVHPSLLKVTKGVAPEARRDAKLKNVIVTEKKIKKNTKYNLETLPHPFETRAQYERSLRLPIGPEWTSRTSFQESTKPRIMVKKGMVVEPMKAPFSVPGKGGKK